MLRSEVSEPGMAKARMEGTMQRLSREIRSLELAGRKHLGGRISSGCVAIDSLLPEGGYAEGSLVEWIGDGAGGGSGWMALAVARQTLLQGKYLLIVDPERRFYPPAAMGMGIPMDRLLVVHPETTEDAWWAMDQGLRSHGVGAVWARLEGALAKHFDDRVARRMQLAAEEGGALGLFMRRDRFACGRPSWAEIQWRVTPLAKAAVDSERRLALQLLRCRGGRPGARLVLAMEGNTFRVLENSRTRMPSGVAQQWKGSGHAGSSALYLASELAFPASDAPAAVADKNPLRTASA